jgi:pyrimidine deaminase RibD-like protein
LQQKKLPEYLQNPSVACVIGDADQIVAQGYTEAPVQDDTDLVRWFFTHLL